MFDETKTGSYSNTCPVPSTVSNSKLIYARLSNFNLVPSTPTPNLLTVSRGESRSFHTYWGGFIAN